MVVIKLQELENDVKYVKGVGPNRVSLLNKLGIYTLKDLITYYPRNYENRGILKKICELQDEEEALIEAVAVTRINEIRTNRKTIFTDVGQICF